MDSILASVLLAPWEVRVTSYDSLADLRSPLLGPRIQALTEIESAVKSQRMPSLVPSATSPAAVHTTPAVVQADHMKEWLILHRIPYSEAAYARPRIVWLFMAYATTHYLELEDQGERLTLVASIEAMREHLRTHALHVRWCSKTTCASSIAAPNGDSTAQMTVALAGHRYHWPAS